MPLSAPAGTAENIISKHPPEFWKDLCWNNKSLFHCPEWHAVLSAGFDTQTFYLWHAATRNAATLPVFRAGPFRIGYLGFPVGTVIGNNFGILDLISNLARSFPIHMIRWQFSAFKEMPSLLHRHHIRPETALTNLQQWSDAMLPASVHRNLKKSRRSDLTVIGAEEPERDGKIMHNLYKQTVTKHGGQLRYTESYFIALARLSGIHPQLRCLMAKSGDQCAAFLVMAIEGDTAYYLHGATKTELSPLRPTDLLFYQAICEARAQGLQSFNMMASPQNQPSLVRFKEKWGGMTRLQTTYDIPLRKTAAKLFHFSYGCYKLLCRR